VEEREKLERTSGFGREGFWGGALWRFFFWGGGFGWGVWFFFFFKLGGPVYPTTKDEHLLKGGCFLGGFWTPKNQNPPKRERAQTTPPNPQKTEKKKKVLG